MHPLSSDHTFDYELLRVLSVARGAGSDVAEVLDAAARIVPTNFDSWHTEFNILAQHAAAQASAEGARRHPVSTAVKSTTTTAVLPPYCCGSVRAWRSLDRRTISSGLRTNR
jgi:hypothetical protein